MSWTVCRSKEQEQFSTFKGHVRVSLMSKGETEGERAMFFVAFVKSRDLLMALFMKVQE